MEYPPFIPQANQIRLLGLVHGQSSDNVRCTSYVVDLPDAPPFDALSYTWGDPKITRSIQVNNADFQATANLEAFLRRRQTESKQRPMWIDAICINQADVQEKTAQVRKMTEIYEKSTWLTVWLGPETRNSNSAIRILINAAKDESSWADECNASDHNGKAQGAIGDILERAWWTRIWIVQEIGFGAKGGVYGFDNWNDAIIDDQQTRLMCGTMSISWGQLVRAADNIARAKTTSE